MRVVPGLRLVAVRVQRSPPWSILPLGAALGSPARRAALRDVCGAIPPDVEWVTWSPG